MIDHRKELDLAIDAAQQQVLATECEQFVYEVILMSLKEKRADLGRSKLARPAHPRRWKWITPARSGSPSSRGARLESTHQ